jgi:hypothetical protein
MVEKCRCRKRGELEAVPAWDGRLNQLRQLLADFMETTRNNPRAEIPEIPPFDGKSIATPPAQKVDPNHGRVLKLVLKNCKRAARRGDQEGAAKHWDNFMREKEWLRKARARAKAGFRAPGRAAPPGFLKKGRPRGSGRATARRALPKPEPRPRGRPCKAPEAFEDRNPEPIPELPKLKRGRPPAAEEGLSVMKRRMLLYERMHGKPWVPPLPPCIPEEPKKTPYGRPPQSPSSAPPTPWSAPSSPGEEPDQPEEFPGLSDSEAE